MVSKVNRDIERDSTTHFESFKYKYEYHQKEIKSIEDELQILCEFLSGITNEYIDGEEIEMLHTFDFVRMGKRLARMQDKFPDYEIVGDWDLSEFVNSVRENTGSFCDE